MVRRTLHLALRLLLLPGMVAAAAPVVTPADATPPYEWHLPPGFAQPRVPSDNPMSAAKVSLGRRLFFDTRMSRTGGYACASCHRPPLAFTDGRARAVGSTGAMLPRSSMSLLNVAYARTFGWRTPGARSLEAQMQQPMFNDHPIELGLRGEEQRMMRDFAADPALAREFAAAFPGAGPAVSITHVIQAIACFERSLIAGRSAFDRYVFDDDRGALTDGAKRGMAIFFSPRGGCGACHFGIAFAGPAATVPDRPAARSAERSKIRPADRHSGPASSASVDPPVFADTGTGGVFKVPTLRNIGVTAPYMHDGRFGDLGAVLDHYEHPGRDAQQGEAVDTRLRPLHLDPSEKQDLIDFLNSLTDLQWAAGAMPAGPGTIISDSALH